MTASGTTFRFAGGLFALALLGACSGSNPPGANNPSSPYEAFDCGAPIGRIIREDCSQSALQYQGANFEGSVGVAGVGAGASYKQTALREADQLVQVLKEQRTSLCHNFNTCKLSVAEYREEQKHLDSTFVALMALKDKMSAMDAESAVRLLDELRDIRTGVRPKEGVTAPVSSAGAAASAGAPPVAQPPTTTTPTTTSTPPSAVLAGQLPEAIPDSRSKVPATTEWDSAPGRLEVPGNGPLGCEVKVLREWLRVSCRGSTNSGGTPVSVEAKGCGTDSYTFANPKTRVASLVVPILKGRRCEAAFTWTDQKQNLILDWSQGERGTVRFEKP